MREGVGVRVAEEAVEEWAVVLGEKGESEVGVGVGGGRGGVEEAAEVEKKEEVVEGVRGAAELRDDGGRWDNAFIGLCDEEGERFVGEVFELGNGSRGELSRRDAEEEE